MTELLGWFSPVRWAILAGLAGALVLGYIAWADRIGDKREAEVSARYEAAISQHKAEAARVLATETNRARESEDRLRTALATLESQDHEAAKTIHRLREDLRVKSRAAGGPGLRDPFAPRCPIGGDSTTGATAAGPVDRPADDPKTGRLLSPQLEQFLLDQAESADAINRAYTACRADALNLRAP